MRRNGRSIGRWSFALWLLLCFFLALVVSGSLPANETSSRISVSSISEKVKSLQGNLQRLERLWKEQKVSLLRAEQIARELSLELAEVRNSLESSLTSLGLSQQEVKRLMSLLAQSEETLRRLSESFQEYRTVAERQIRSLSILLGTMTAGGVLFILVTMFGR